MSNYILYRKADLSDIEALAELRVEMLCENKDYSKDFKTDLYINTTQYMENGFYDSSFISWVAMNTHSKIIATSGLTFYDLPPNDWCPNGKTAYLSSLYTLPEFRRKGIAKHLIALNIEEAKKNDCQRILLNTADISDTTDTADPTTASAVIESLYKKFGFETSESAMAYFPFGKHHEKQEKQEK